jgi:hypothetical protein
VTEYVKTTADRVKGLACSCNSIISNCSYDV